MEQIPIFKCRIGICDFVPMLLQIGNCSLKLRVFIIITVKYTPKLISVFRIIIRLGDQRFCVFQQMFRRFMF